MEKRQHEYIVSSLHYIRAKHQVVNRGINGEIGVLLAETSSAWAAILTWVTEVTHVRYPTVMRLAKLELRADTDKNSYLS